MNRILVFAFMTVALVLTKLPSAFAHAHHTANVCSTTAPDICAHLGFENEPNTTDESQFMLHFMPKSGGPTLVTKVAVKLWMDEMGHGSAPVTLTAVDDAHYEVTKAYFVMSGPWQVKVSFEFGGASHEISIPVDVK